jgi:hypothetical protein
MASGKLSVLNSTSTVAGSTSTWQQEAGRHVEVGSDNKNSPLVPSLNVVCTLSTSTWHLEVHKIIQCNSCHSTQRRWTSSVRQPGDHGSASAKDKLRPGYCTSIAEPAERIVARSNWPFRTGCAELCSLHAPIVQRDARVQRVGYRTGNEYTTRLPLAHCNGPGIAAKGHLPRRQRPRLLFKRRDARRCCSLF